MSKRKALMSMVRGLVLVASMGFGAAVAADGEVRVGVLTDMGGSYADVSGKGSVTAAQMAIEDFGGSVLGKPIKLLSADHQQKPDIAANIARNWFDNDGVDVILDLPQSASALAVQNVAKERKKISIITTGWPELATGAQCSSTGVHWVDDTYSAGKTLALALQKQPGDKWFFIVLDSVAGEYLQKATMRFIQPLGGEVVGSVRHPISTSDFSSFVLQAQASGAKYIALGNAGGDLITAVKQAKEFGIEAGGQKLVAIAMFLSDVKAIGLEGAQGMVYATGFFPGQSEEASAWSKRFKDRHGAMPNDGQAGVYSSLMHYLKALQAAGTTESGAVMAKMRDMSVNDMFTENGRLREDGRMVHDTFLVQVKTPSESKDPWDLVKLVEVIPGDKAFRPLSESDCPLIKK